MPGIGKTSRIAVSKMTGIFFLDKKTLVLHNLSRGRSAELQIRSPRVYCTIAKIILKIKI